MDTMVARRQPVLNRLLLPLLHSPLAGGVDGVLLGLTVRGRRSGRAITLPVQFAAGDDAIWVRPADPKTKMRWRNLRPAGPVRLRLLGQDLAATAQTLRGDEDPAEVERGLRAWADRFSRTAKAGFGGHPTAGELAPEEVQPAVMVRITPPQAALELLRLQVVAGERGRLESLDRRWLRRWGWVAVAGLLALAVLAALALATDRGDAVAGGWTWQAAALALLEGLVAVGLSLWVVAA